MVDIALFEHLGAADIVAPERVAAIEHDIAGGEQLGELSDHVLGDLAGRQHHPYRARRPQLLHQLVETAGARCAVAAQCGDRLGVVIVDDHLVAILDQAAGNIAAHAAETDHADLHHQLRSRQCALYRGLELGKAGFQIALEMYAQRAPAALQQHIEIAAGLRRFHHAKTRAVRRDRQILGVVRGDLQKHAAVRPAFVGLAGRMQKARAEFETSRDMAAVAHRQPRLLQGRGIGVVARDIGQHGKIVAGADAAEMRLEPAIECRAGTGGA